MKQIKKMLMLGLVAVFVVPMAFMLTACGGNNNNGGGNYNGNSENGDNGNNGVNPALAAFVGTWTRPNFQGPEGYDQQRLTFDDKGNATMVNFNTTTGSYISLPQWTVQMTPFTVTEPMISQGFPDDVDRVVGKTALFVGRLTPQVPPYFRDAFAFVVFTHAYQTQTLSQFQLSPNSVTTFTPSIQFATVSGWTRL